MRDTTTDIQSLLQRSHIIDRINSLFIATDERDWQRVEECFTASVDADLSALGGGGPATMAAGDLCMIMDRQLKSVKTSHHQVGNCMVTVDGEQATVFAYATIFHQMYNRDLGIRTLAGSYAFTLQVADADWYISSIGFRLKFTDGVRDLELERITD